MKWFRIGGTLTLNKTCFSGCIDNVLGYWSCTVRVFSIIEDALLTLTLKIQAKVTCFGVPLLSHSFAIFHGFHEHSNLYSLFMKENITLIYAVNLHCDN